MGEEGVVRLDAESGRVVVVSGEALSNKEGIKRKKEAWSESEELGGDEDLVLYLAERSARSARRKRATEALLGPYEEAPVVFSSGNSWTLRATVRLGHLTPRRPAAVDSVALAVASSTTVSELAELAAERYSSLFAGFASVLDGRVRDFGFKVCGRREFLADPSLRLDDYTAAAVARDGRKPLDLVLLRLRRRTPNWTRQDSLNRRAQHALDARALLAPGKKLLPHLYGLASDLPDSNVRHDNLPSDDVRDTEVAERKRREIRRVFEELETELWGCADKRNTRRSLFAKEEAGPVQKVVLGRKALLKAAEGCVGVRMTCRKIVLSARAMSKLPADEPHLTARLGLKLREDAEDAIQWAVTDPVDAANGLAKWARDQHLLLPEVWPDARRCPRAVEVVTVIACADKVVGRGQTRLYDSRGHLLPHRDVLIKLDAFGTVMGLQFATSDAAEYLWFDDEPSALVPSFTRGSDNSNNNFSEDTTAPVEALNWEQAEKEEADEDDDATLSSRQYRKERSHRQPAASASSSQRRDERRPSFGGLFSPRSGGRSQRRRRCSSPSTVGGGNGCKSPFKAETICQSPSSELDAGASREEKNAPGTESSSSSFWSSSAAQTFRLAIDDAMRPDACAARRPLSKFEKKALWVERRYARLVYPGHLARWWFCVDQRDWSKLNDARNFAVEWFRASIARVEPPRRRSSKKVESEQTAKRELALVVPIPSDRVWSERCQAALECLERGDVVLRGLAAQRLDLLSDQDLELVLPQLVQALKLEMKASIDSPLTRLVLGRAIASPDLAFRAFWLLKSEEEDTRPPDCDALESRNKLGNDDDASDDVFVRTGALRRLLDAAVPEDVRDRLVIASRVDDCFKETASVLKSLTLKQARGQKGRKVLEACDQRVRAVIGLSVTQEPQPLQRVGLSSHLRGHSRDHEIRAVKQKKLFEKRASWVHAAAGGSRAVESGGSAAGCPRRRVFCTCLDSRLECCSVEKGRVLSSKKQPVALTLRCDDPDGDDDGTRRCCGFEIIYKLGDDLRQDALALQLVGVMDGVWRERGLYLVPRPYKVQATSRDAGCVEVVRNSLTTADVQVEFGKGARGAFKDGVISQYFARHHPDPRGFEACRTTFVASCAAYCVATRVLGVGDRHADNVMVSSEGRLFHVDFGHLLGNFKSKFGVRRERTPLLFTPDMKHVMTRPTLPPSSPGNVVDAAFRRLASPFRGRARPKPSEPIGRRVAWGGCGDVSDDTVLAQEALILAAAAKHPLSRTSLHADVASSCLLGDVDTSSPVGYADFERLCCRAYNALRDRAQILVALLALMLPAQLPELDRRDDLDYVLDALNLRLSPAKAADKFKLDLAHASSDVWRRVDNYFHNRKHHHKQLTG